MRKDGREGQRAGLVGLHLALLRLALLYLELMMGSLRSSFHSRAVQSPADRKNFGKKGLRTTAYTGPWWPGGQRQKHDAVSKFTQQLRDEAGFGRTEAELWSAS